MVLYKEIEKFEKTQRVKCVFTVEKPNDMWRGPVGRISIDIIKNHVKDLKRSVFYICGPPAMSENKHR